MDPISLIFSAYLDLVQSQVHKQLTDSLGTELKSIEIEYQGQKIPFQYQMWRVREKSVCSPYQMDALKYSKCTIAAKNLFTELCQTLNQSKSDHWRRIRSQQMYCNAAVSYKPRIASIGEAKEESELLVAKKACNAATVAALGSSDVGLSQKREVTCAYYKELKVSKANK